MNQKFGLSPLTIQLVPLYYLYPKNGQNVRRPDYIQANMYIHIYYIYVSTYILYISISIYIYIYIYIIYIIKIRHKRTQYLCVTEEELLYDSGEQSFDLS